MAKRRIKFADLTIANAGTTSGVLTIPKEVSELVVHRNGALTGTVTVHGSLDASAYDPLYDVVGAKNITIGADKVQHFNVGGLTGIKLISGSAEGAERDFIVAGVVDQL